MSFEKVPNFIGNFFTAEMTVDEQRFFRFKSFLLDTEERQLRQGESVVSLTPKAFDTLVFLVRRSGHLVAKDELMAAIWPDSFVDEGNIPRTIYTLRKALGEEQNGTKFIETVPTKGYRFVAPVTGDCKTNGETILPSELDHAGVVKISVQPGAQTDERVHPTAAVQFPLVHGWTVRNLALTVGAVGGVLVALWFFFGSVVGGANEPKSIAVLPVRALTGQAGDPIFELGIADALITRFGTAKNLTVRQLDAVRKYKNLEMDAVTAGKEQRVDYVLASSYQIADTKVRITSQLINVSTGAVEDVFKIDEDGSDAFAVQTAAARRIGDSVLNRLRRHGGGEGPKRYTSNEEAYRLYLLGTSLADSREPKAFQKAVECFEQAVKLDPKFVLAYAGLANAHTAMSLQGNVKGADEYFKAKKAIEQALAIDDTAAESHTYFGELKGVKEWDYVGAETEFRRGIELNPNSSAAHRMYALLLGYVGRTDEAVSEIKTAVDLEPASVLNHKIYARILYSGRRYDDAIAEGKLAVDMEPNAPEIPSEIANSYFRKGDGDEAFYWFIQERGRAGDTAEEIETWKKVYADSGWRGLRERQIYLGMQAEKNGYVPPMSMALLYAEQGDRERAFDYIEKAFASRQWGVVKLKMDPALDPLRGDPRFADLLRRINMS